MTENNIKDPQHYKIGNLETIDLIQKTVKDFGSVCQANILKYGIRANKKHENPKDDIQKIIRYGEFWLNHLEDKPASSPRVEEIATIDKLKDMLNEQEKELIQDKKIKCVVLDGKQVPKEIAQDLLDRLGGM
ncbi:Protein of unknwon function (DUF3310) [Gemella morbillorum]|uniref:DUF3310 domain-containing protein n=1 Tax=Gemella morbillorum TaxID=29391 RepID=UPI000DA32B72|nr:DUF3310 domain-containing protein [Gemella morbillorum]UBH81405.1 DUF3310 domain-containing protein [Gemella morbillorum]SQH55175.1 Protein of unknwon function (DUF3310) [Gemella morbillorum]